MVRDATDGMSTIGAKVTVATFLSNDIFVPNPVYQLRESNLCDGSGGDCAVIVGVYKDWAMDQMYDTKDKRQSDDYNLGVLYPSDANAVDQRGRFIAFDDCDTPASNCYWDSRIFNFDAANPPGNFDDVNGQGRINANPKSGQFLEFTHDNTQWGTSAFYMGNPYEVPTGGGGTGCHIGYNNAGDGLITNGVDVDLSNLQGNIAQKLNKNGDCQCNPYWGKDIATCDPKAFSGCSANDGGCTISNCWDTWIDQWVKEVYPQVSWKYNFGRRDLDICWMDNFRDLINMQNWFWIKKSDWIDWQTQAPYDYSWWGWNELPVNTDLLAVSNIETHAIVLPVSPDPKSYTLNPDYLDDKPLRDLDKNLCCHYQNGYIQPGEPNWSNDHFYDSPSSSVMWLAQEYKDSIWWGGFETYRYKRTFFCWSKTLQHFDIVHEDKFNGDKCLVVWKKGGKRWCNKNANKFCTNFR